MLYLYNKNKQNITNTNNKNDFTGLWDLGSIVQLLNCSSVPKFQESVFYLIFHYDRHIEHSRIQKAPLYVLFYVLYVSMWFII